MRHCAPLALACLLALALSACPGKTVKPPAGPDASCPATDPACNPNACETASDCGEVRVYDCVNAACVPVCTVKADCLHHPAFNDGPWTGCENGMCVCDARKCLPSACADDSECAGKVCRSGVCDTPDIDPDSCALSADAVVLRKDQPVTLTAIAYKGNRVALLGPGAFVWKSGDPCVAKVDEAGTFKGAAASGGWKPGAIVASVKSKPSITCSAKALVLDAFAGARVAVVDEMTGRLVPGKSGVDTVMKVVFNGTEMAEDAANSGIFTLPSVPFQATWVVSVFHKDFQYLTVVGVTRSDLLLPIRRSADDTRGGGFAGKFTNFPDTEVSFGITGTSIPGNYTDLDPNVLLGRIADTEVTFASRTFSAPLPSASMLGVGTTRFKGGYQAWGTAGVCAQEDEVMAGTCGTRTAFGLMGSLPVSVITPVFNDIYDKKPVDIGTVLTIAMPYLKTFTSSVSRDVTYKLKVVPTDVNALYADTDAFKPVDMTPKTTLALEETVVVPDMPSAAGTQLDAAIVIAASQVAGRGLVPLGVTAGTDTSADCPASTKNGRLVGVDVISDNPVKTACHDDSRLSLRMAPNHDGIEGSRYGLVALAIPATAVLANGAAAIGAVAVNRTAMPYGSEITFADGYLGFVEAASYDFRAGKFSDVALVNGAGVHRAMFNAAGNRRWTVYFNKAAFDMPKAPQGFEDRTLDDKVDRASSTGKRSSIQYWAIKAKDGDAPLGVDELFDFAAGRAMNLSSYLTAFSMYDAEPSLGFNEPSGDACDKDGLCSVADGNFVFKVKIAAFEVPTKVKILLEASSGQKVILDAMSADWIAQGKFSTPLMMDTTGNHTVTATMVKPDADPAHPELATPIDPKVVATLKVFVKS